MQSITAQQDFRFNKIALRIKRVDGGAEANFKLSVYPDNSNQPDFNNPISSAMFSNVLTIDENQDAIFTFNNPISVVSGNKYWLALEVESYNVNNFLPTWQMNAWQNLVADGNLYADGEAGSVRKNLDGSYSSVNITPDQDWYMKIGLGQ